MHLTSMCVLWPGARNVANHRDAVQYNYRHHDAAWDGNRVPTQGRGDRLDRHVSRYPDYDAPSSPGLPPHARHNFNRLPTSFTGCVHSDLCHLFCPALPHIRLIPPMPRRIECLSSSISSRRGLQFRVRKGRNVRASGLRVVLRPAGLL